MSRATERIETLIAEAEQWRKFHKARGATIEALGAAIRIRALKDAIAAVKEPQA
jgi:hypothetical protein